MDYSDSLDQFCLEADQQFDQLLSQMTEKQLTEILETTQTSFPYPVEQQPHPARFAEPKSRFSKLKQAQYLTTLKEPQHGVSIFGMSGVQIEGRDHMIILLHHTYVQ